METGAARPGVSGLGRHARRGALGGWIALALSACCCASSTAATPRALPAASPGAGAGSAGSPAAGTVGQTPAQILAEALRASNQTTSVRVIGSFTTGGRSLSLDLSLVAGVGGEGTVTQDGLSFRIIRIGTKAYFSASEGFWQHFDGAAAAQLFAGRWIETGASDGQFASLTALTEMRALLSSALSTSDPLTLGKTVSIGGRPALALLDTSHGGTVYVASSGTPYPLAVSAGSAHSLITFESWNVPVKLVAPSDPVDLSALPQAAPRPIPGQGVSLALPPGWSGSTATVAGMPSIVKYVAYAPATFGPRANLTLIVEPLPSGDTLRQAFFSGASAAYQYVGSSHAVTVGGVPGLTYRSTKAFKAGTQPLLTEVWGFVQHGQMYLFTFTALASSGAEYSAAFAHAAASIRFTSSAGTTTA
jgi:hypothetical protein